MYSNNNQDLYSVEKESDRKSLLKHATIGLLSQWANLLQFSNVCKLLKVSEIVCWRMQHWNATTFNKSHIHLIHILCLVIWWMSRFASWLGSHFYFVLRPVDDKRLCCRISFAHGFIPFFTTFFWNTNIYFFSFRNCNFTDVTTKFSVTHLMLYMK